MIKSYTAVFLFVCFASFSQQISVQGVVHDANTKEPIISASVGIKNAAVGTITNEEGNFQLTVPKSAQIVISFIGYKTATIPLADFTGQTKTILLEQDAEMLEEVMVSKTPIEKILEQLVTVSRARFNKPIVLNTYYREFVKLNGKHSKFSDGLLDYHISGTTKKSKSDLIVKQSRVAQLYSQKDVDENDAIELDSFLNVKDGITNNYDFTSITQLLLNKDRFKDYELTLKSKKSSDGNERFAIVFEPKPEVEKALYQGSITYDPKTKLIYDIDFYRAPSHAQYINEMNILIAKVTYLDAKLKASYKMVGNNYVLSFSNQSNKFRIRTKKRYDETIESRSDLIVTNFGIDDLAYNKKEVYNEKDLFSRGNKFTDKFWLKNNSIVLTADEEAIIAALEKPSVSAP